MVQYVITPWIDRRELLGIREAFYPSAEFDDASARCRNAVALVSVWVQRGNCPHLIESTALLISAILNDSHENSAYAMRAAYSAAFCRFVTGLLDGYQDKRHKLSMYSIAKNIGLPATFVELRHQCTHEELPSLPKLRSAAEKSLQWIWGNYWKDLQETSLSSAQTEDCRTIVREYLSWRTGSERQNPEQRKRFAERIGKWDAKKVVDTIMELNGSDSGDAGVLLQSTRLARALLSGQQELFSVATVQDDKQPAEAERSMTLDDIRAEMARAREALEDDPSEGIPIIEGEESAEDSSVNSDDERTSESEDDGEDEEGDEECGSGWQIWMGPWIPKPIGIV